MKYRLLATGELIFIVIVSICFKAGAMDIPDLVIKGEAGEKMDEYLHRLEAFDFHGSVLVAHKGEVWLHNAYGLAQVENDIKNHTSTLFSTGSVTKQFTATAIMKLVDEGLVQVTDSIGKFFENVPDEKKGITVHHLLTHTAGLPPDYGRDKDPIKRDDYIRRVMERPLPNPIGTYQYSNGGYALLAAIIELVSGMEFERFLIEKLFKPNGMMHTGLKYVAVPDSLVSHSHNANLNYISPQDRPEDCWNLTGSGGILTTPGDMYRWHRAMWDGNILFDESREMMFTAHVQEYPEEPTYYGYGWVVQQSQRRDNRVIWHNGGAMPHGWGCSVYYYVDDEALFIIFANKPMSGMMPADHLAMGLSRILFNEPLVMPPEIKEITVSSALNYNGQYRSEPDSLIFSVDVKDNQLHITPIGQEAMMALHPTRMAAMLPKYNDLTYQMLEATSLGEYARAIEFWEVVSGDDITEMHKAWWSEFEKHGALKEIKILGTKMGPGAETYCELIFEKGREEICCVWRNGKCLGIMPDKRPIKILKSQSGHKFVDYSLATGMIFSAEFNSDGQLLLEDGRRTITAEAIE